MGDAGGAVLVDQTAAFETVERERRGDGIGRVTSDQIGEYMA